MHDPLRNAPAGTTTSPRRARSAEEGRQLAPMPRWRAGEWTRVTRSRCARDAPRPERHQGPELLPIRHERMALSRGTTTEGGPVMAADLASVPTAARVQLCGRRARPHFGCGHPGANLSFDLRDFDETLPGPFEWDVKRWPPAWSWPPPGTASSPSGPRWRDRGRRVLRHTHGRYARPRARHLVRRHARRQFDRLLRTRRPGPRVGVHREEEEAPDQPHAFTKLTAMAHGGRASPRTPRSRDDRRRRAG